MPISLPAKAARSSQPPLHVAPAPLGVPDGTPGSLRAVPPRALPWVGVAWCSLAAGALRGMSMPQLSSQG